MKLHSESALASILLTSHVIRREEAPLATAEYWDLVSSISDPAQLLGLDAVAVAARLGCSASESRRIAALLDSGTALAVGLDQLEQTGIRVLTPFDEAYPVRLRERLGRAAPPALHVAGPASLLGSDGIGIVGSRAAGADAREIAAEIAQAASSAGLSVVSGLARGIDQVAMSSALEADGNVVGIPADALNKVVRDPSVRRSITGERLCIATPFAPSAGFSVGAAMGRNKLIYALSRVTLVVASDHGKGGTWAGAVEALEKGIGAVAVWTGSGAGEGNEALVARGGIAVGDSEAVLSVREVKVAGSPRGERTQLRMEF